MVQVKFKPQYLVFYAHLRYTKVTNAGFRLWKARRIKLDAVPVGGAIPQKAVQNRDLGALCGLVPEPLSKPSPG
jgi:hypothetical protein